MMKITVIYFELILIYLVYHTYAQTVICNSINGYDTQTLTHAVQWEVTTDYQCLSKLAADCTYYISFCRAAPMCFNEYSACQNVTGSSNMTIIGDFTTVVFYENKSGEEGFYAQFPSGPLQNISSTTLCSPSLKIKFKCNHDAKWLVPLITNVTGTAPEPYDIELDPSNPCLTIMIFDYSGACLNATTSTTSTTTMEITTATTTTTSTTSTTTMEITTATTTTSTTSTTTMEITTATITTSTTSTTTMEITTATATATVTTYSTGNTAKPMVGIQCGLIFLITIFFQQ